MSNYPTPEQLSDPNFVWPLEYAAPQDRGEPVPAANPAPGPDSVTEPAPETKDFSTAADVPPSEWMASSGDKDENGGEPAGGLAASSGSGSTPAVQESDTANDPSSQPAPSSDKGDSSSSTQSTPQGSNEGSADDPSGSGTATSPAPRRRK
jgi:hypothetical protein